MKNCKFYMNLILIWTNIIFIVAIREDICEKCVKVEDCPMFARIKIQDQRLWLEQFPCDSSQSSEELTIFGISLIAKGDYVCCPKENIWGLEVDNENNFHKSINNNNNFIQNPVQTIPNDFSRNGNFQLENYPKNHIQISSPSHQENNLYQRGNPFNQNFNGIPQSQPGNLNIFGNQPSPNGQNVYHNQQNGPNNPNINRRPMIETINQNINGIGQTHPHGQNIYENQQNIFNGPPYLNNEGSTWSKPGSYNINQQNPYQRGGISPGQIQNQNPYYLQKPNPFPQQQNTYLNNGNVNSMGRTNSGQCSVQTTLLPDPETGCCGEDTSYARSITDLQSILNMYAPSNQNRWTNQPQQGYQNIPYYQQRYRSSTENETVDVILDNRITGGKETELDQFPWTVLLKITFDYGDRQIPYSCGGSLISINYVLTAGHCVYEKNANLVDIELTLAEYDKRTFPRDCKSGLGEKKQCIDNVLMHAEDIILHPQYDNNQLFNDIALVRLRGYAPYTRYIRSICLPPINIDDPDFSNLPLAVAGWGRNGPYITDIKQSTVVHLVTHDECERFYPTLSRSQLCAAGLTGEDTCKGDSGGPLMMLYRNNYYVVGIVSGKRADSPCGTSVPSLYTNVYQYVPWIKNVIRS